MKIHWTIQRNNLDDERDPVMAVDCVLTIQGRIEIDGEKAGQLFAWYLASNQLDTPRAFWELWDLTGDICSIYEDIKSPQRTGFHEPLPRLLADAPGLIVVDFIALRPAFRRRGLGMEALREIVRRCADERVGAVLLDARPLQHRPEGYDEFDEEIRELPWNDGEVDQDRLMNHFRSGGIQRLPRTRFMVCAPDVITAGRADAWPPVPITEDREDDEDLPF